MSADSPGRTCTACLTKDYCCQAESSDGCGNRFPCALCGQMLRPGDDRCEQCCWSVHADTPTARDVVAFVLAMSEHPFAGIEPDRADPDDPHYRQADLVLGGQRALISIGPEEQAHRLMTRARAERTGAVS